MIRLCNNKGFTLVELMLAAAIIIIALGALLHLFNYCLTLSITAGNIPLAAAEAYGKLEEIRLQDYDSIIDYDAAAFDLAQLTGTGAVSVSYVPGTNDELLQVNVTVSYIEKGRTINLQLVSMIAER